MKFQPATLVVQVGDTIEWTNMDFVDHNVTEEKNKEWNSGTLKTGQSWQYVVKRPADYYCSIHVVMKGKLVLNDKK